MSTFKKVLVVSVFMLMSLALLGIAGVGSAQCEVIKLTYGSLYRPSHPTGIADLAWIQKIEKETDGRVKITPYWNASLIGKRENVTQLRKGVADIGYVTGDYAASGFDIVKAVKGYFFGCPDRFKAQSIYKKVRQEFPQIDGEFEGMKVLAYQAHPPYQLLTKKPIRTLADIKGQKLEVTGIYAKVAKALGAEGVAMPIGDVYMAIEKGILDGGILPTETLKSFRFAEVVKYCTILNITAAPVQHRAMNLKTWNSLPPDIQKVFEDNIEWWGDKIEEEMFKIEDQVVDYAKKEGIQFITLPPEELNAFYKIMDDVVSKEAAVLDAKGIPGTAIYQAIRKEIDK